jgi:hypothetical protein
LIIVSKSQSGHPNVVKANFIICSPLEKQVL